MAESEADFNKKPVQNQNQQEKQLRFYISSLNSFVGYSLVEAIRNDNKNDINPHFIVGSKCENEDNDIPNGVFRTIDTTKINFLAEVLLDSDVIIYDLNTCNLEEAEFAIKTLKMGNYTDEKLLICISNVMTWSNTPPKEKKEGDEGDEGENPEGEEDSDQEQQQEAGNDDEQVQKKVYVKFTENDYTLRKPFPKYEMLKSLETMCISAGNQKSNLKSFVLCSGILYGNGENIFYNQFRQAWLQNPAELTIYGDGKNRIPSIHVKDLAEFVIKVVERPPNQPYIFAIDHNPKPTQKKIIQSISSGVGSGGVKTVNRAEGALENEYFDILNLDLRLRPSKVFDVGEEEEQQEEEDENAPPKFKFNWHCKEGISKNINKVCEEFNQFRDLRPNKIFIQGPVASGKTFYSKQLAELYNIPQITIKDVVELYLKTPGEAGDAIREKYEEIKAEQLEKAREQFEQDKKKKKKAKGEQPEEFEEKSVVIRLPEDMLAEAFKMRLSKTDCRNRGYIIDGYPKTFEQAKAIFMKLKPSEEGEEPADDEDAPKILNTDLVPESIIIIDASNEFLKDFIKENLKEEDVQGTHYTEEGMTVRLQTYRENNDKEKGTPILVDFFTENSIDVKEINIENEQNDVFDQMKSFIERNGEFSNYMVHEQEEEEKRRKQVLELRQQEKLKQEEEQKQKDQKEEQARQLQDKESDIKEQQKRQNEREILDSRSQPLRQYLADNVVPFITEGLIEICKNPTENPVDALAEYLFKRSLEVQFPDPCQYNLK